MPVPEAWKPGLREIVGLPEGGIALVVGSVDRGKTTFVSLASRILAARRGRVAVIDTDIGQSEIGPPGTVGVAWARADAEKLLDLAPFRQFFVGAFTPPPVLMEMVVAVGQAASVARQAGAEAVLVDTTGFVFGPVARRLKMAKAQLLQPSLILGVGTAAEMDNLLFAMGAASGTKTVRIDSPPELSKKPAGLRAARRVTRLARFLEEAVEIALPLSRVATTGAALGSGAVVSPELVRWAAQATRLPVVHAEIAEGTLHLFLKSDPARGTGDAGVGVVAAQFKVPAVRFISLARYTDTFLGLHGMGGQLLAVGRFLRFNPEHSALVVSAHVACPEKIEWVQFGRVRVGADGSAGAEVRPGEL